MKHLKVDAGGGLVCAPGGAPAQLIAYRVFISHCKMSCVPRIPGDDLRNEKKSPGRGKKMAWRRNTKQNGVATAKNPHTLRGLLLLY